MLSTSGNVVAGGTITLNTPGYTIKPKNGTLALHAGFITATGLVFQNVTPQDDGYIVKVPFGIAGQNYVVLTRINETVSDDTVVAGPAIIEVNIQEERYDGTRLIDLIGNKLKQGNEIFILSAIGSTSPNSFLTGHQFSQPCECSSHLVFFKSSFGFGFGSLLHDELWYNWKFDTCFAFSVPLVVAVRLTLSNPEDEAQCLNLYNLSVMN